MYDKAPNLKPPTPAARVGLLNDFNLKFSQIPLISKNSLIKGKDNEKNIFLVNDFYPWCFISP
jgi:hypothetical protein